nr:helix-turn-helix domain-containing protein [Micromonospora sp. DSM 115978]
MALIRRRLVQRRKAMGYTQESIAEKVRVDRSTIVRWERAETDPLPTLRIRLANALDLTLDDLDEHLAHIVIAPGRPKARRNATATVEPDTGGDPSVNRRTFTITTALASLGVTSPLRDWITSPDVPAKLGMEHMRTVAATIEQFRRTDAATGGDLLCDVAITMHRRLTRWEREASYDHQVSEALQESLGDLEAEIGWLALDAERRPESRRYLQDAILRARLRDDPRLEVRALQQLSMLVRDTDPHESLRFVEAAQRIAAPWAPPRLATLLHLRSMFAYALANDTSGFNRELVKAKISFDRGTHDDDPSYLDFVNADELNGIEGAAMLALNQPNRAESAYRRAIAHADPTYRRNLAMRELQVAEALRRQGDFVGASEVAIGAVPTVTAMHSRRTSRRFATLRSNLGEVAPRVPRARDFTATYDSAMVGRH